LTTHPFGETGTLASFALLWAIFVVLVTILAILGNKSQQGARGQLRNCDDAGAWA